MDNNAFLSVLDIATTLTNLGLTETMGDLKPADLMAFCKDRRPNLRVSVGWGGVKGVQQGWRGRATAGPDGLLQGQEARPAESKWAKDGRGRLCSREGTVPMGSQQLDGGRCHPSRVRERMNHADL